jgi:hypothetical protein
MVFCKNFRKDFYEAVQGQVVNVLILAGPYCTQSWHNMLDGW